jgi:hypothetical protein
MKEVSPSGGSHLGDRRKIFAEHPHVEIASQ